MKVRQPSENEAPTTDAKPEPRLAYEAPRITRKRSLERAILFSGGFTTGSTGSTGSTGLTSGG